MAPFKPATSSSPIRLNLFLARFAGVSRRKADFLIETFQVKVNGQKAFLGQKVKLSSDLVTLNGRTILPTSEPKVYLVLNKPVGYITTTSDQFGRRSVVELIPQSPRLYPVGRLDSATAGLLLFTNDGQISLLLTHPRYHLPKTYEVITTRSPNPAQIRLLQTGVRLSDGPTLPARAKLIGPTPNGFNWQLTLREGRNRQIRRLCDQLGLKLVSLMRLSLGPLTLGNLRVGQYRYLTNQEISKLKSVVELTNEKEVGFR
ncbi:MAG: pseudouridine synthase [Candidatus Shapirobacteria bacterium]